VVSGWVLNTYKFQVTYTSTENTSLVAVDAMCCRETCKYAVVGKGEGGQHRYFVCQHLDEQLMLLV